MGFEIFGYKFFDLSSKVTYGDAFLSIGIVCIVAFVLFLFVKINASKNI